MDTNSNKSYNEIRHDILTAITVVNHFGLKGSLTYLNGIENILPDMVAFYSTAMSLLPKAYEFSDKKAEYPYIDYARYEFVMAWYKNLISEFEFAFYDNGGAEVAQKFMEEAEEIYKGIIDLEPKRNHEKNDAPVKDEGWGIDDE